MISIKNTIFQEKGVQKVRYHNSNVKKSVLKNEVSKLLCQEKYGHFDRIDSQLMTILGLFTDCTTLPQPE